MDQRAKRHPYSVMAGILLGLTFAAGCAPAPLRADFNSPNPTAKMRAIEEAARTQQADRDTLLRIIEQLDSDDPAVRFVAISALQKLTGETHGYDHTAPRSERDKATLRWIDAYREEDRLAEPSAPDVDMMTRNSSGGRDG